MNNRFLSKGGFNTPAPKPEHGSIEEHQNLVKDFMIEVSEQFPDVMVLTYTNGMFRAFDNPDRIVHAGQKGVLDVIVLGKGFYLWFDGKTGKARFTPEQTAFTARMREINGKCVCYKLTSVEQGIDDLLRHYNL